LCYNNFTALKYKKGVENMGIHENIRKLREERKLTLEEVGKRTGTTKQTIKRYESGEISTIPYDRILSLAECFGVSPGNLMGWEESKEIIESADLDADVIFLSKEIKEYAIKLSKLSEQDKKYVFDMIDRLGK
jgi:transcriptional regulator with XRE-family HTH domain